MTLINSNTDIFVAVAGNKSTNGVYFYNAMFAELGINAVYVSASTTTIRGLKDGLRCLGIRGASVASPYKLEVALMCDELQPFAKASGAVNSIKCAAGPAIIGDNTDVSGMISVLSRYKAQLPGRLKVVIYGSGGVVSSVLLALRHVFPNCCITIQARNRARAAHLAEQFSVTASDLKSALACDLFVNATPVSAYEPDDVVRLASRANVILDLLPSQETYPFEEMIAASGRRLIRGFDVYLAQLRDQFSFLVGTLPEESLLTELAVARPTH
jgi:shikimate dehydrogenase